MPAFPVREARRDKHGDLVDRDLGLGQAAPPHHEQEARRLAGRAGRQHPGAVQGHHGQEAGAAKAQVDR